MQKQPEYIVGWIDASIHDFFSEINRPPTSMAYTLITCLDSSFNVSSLVEKSKHLQSLKGDYEQIGNGLLVETNKLLKVEHKNRIFFGFDEVWFFPYTRIKPNPRLKPKSKLKPKPDEITLIGPNRVNPLSLQELSDWMRDEDCYLGLGDGVGMNYCLRIHGITRYFVRALNDDLSEM